MKDEITICETVQEAERFGWTFLGQVYQWGLMLFVTNKRGVIKFAICNDMGNNCIEFEKFIPYWAGRKLINIEYPKSCCYLCGRDEKSGDSLEENQDGNTAFLVCTDCLEMEATQEKLKIEKVKKSKKKGGNK